MAGHLQDGWVATGEVEDGLQGAADRSDRLPDGLMHLAEKEQAQRISLRQLFAEQEHGLRQKYADWILLLLGSQFVVADLVFVVFAWAGRGWDLPSGVVEVWLVATVVQVVGVVAVVTRHLFPSRDAGEMGAV
jgi:uncharacterized membrane protein